MDYPDSRDTAADLISKAADELIGRGLDFNAEDMKVSAVITMLGACREILLECDFCNSPQIDGETDAVGRVTFHEGFGFPEGCRSCRPCAKDMVEFWQEEGKNVTFNEFEKVKAE